jgi:integrase
MRNRGLPEWVTRIERHARRTFAEAATKYLQGYEGKDKRRVAYALKSLTPYVGDLVLMDVNDDALSDFKRDRAQGLGKFTRPASAGTINFEITLASTILNCACREWEWLPRALKLKRVHGARKQPYPLTWEEQDRLFVRLPQHWAEGLALFGVNTGVRQDELLGLRWDQEVKVPTLDTFVFVLSDTKNDQPRAVICNSLARLAVDRQRDNGSEYVFASRSNRSKGERMRYLDPHWWDAWKAAGLPTDKWTRRGPHNMRHTFAHRLRLANVSEEDRNALLGHAKTNLAQHYAMPDIERLTKLSELVTQRTEGVILRRAVA